MGTPPTPPAGQPPADSQEQPHGLTFAAEHSLIGARAVTFRTQGLNPPSILYTTADDGLYINVSNLQPGQTLTFASQFLLPDGRLQPMVWTVNPPPTGAATAYLFPLTEGYLFNLTCTPAGSTRRGSTWVYAAIRRGNLLSGVNLQTLLQDYVDSLSGPTWPGGTLRSSTDGVGLMTTQFTNSVTAGQPFNYTVPAYARVRVRSIMVFLATSAAVGNRDPYLLLSDNSTNQIFHDEIEPAMVASKSVFMCWAFMLGWAQTALSQNNMARSLPDLILNPGYTLQVNADGLLAGDQFQFITLCLESWFSV